MPSRDRLAALLLLLLLTGLTGLAAGCGRDVLLATPSSTPARPLAPGTAVDAHLDPGQDHAYAVPLAAGDFLEVRLEQQGADVLLVLFDPSGREVVTVDGLNGGRGPEVLYAVAEEKGEHRLEVHPWLSGTTGDYRLAVSPPRPADERDRLRAAAARELAAAVRLAGSGEAACQRGAASRYDKARELWRRGREPAGLALTVGLHGQLLAGLEQSERAAELFEQALGLFQALGRQEELPSLLNDLGNAYADLDDAARARDAFEEARERAAGLGNRREEALAFENLAVLLAVAGRSWEALELHERALPVFKELGDRETVISVLHNAGSLLLWLGELAQARTRLEEALALERELGDEDRVASTLSALGRLALDHGEPETARQLFEQVLDLRRSRGDGHGEALALLGLAETHLVLGDVETALGESLTSLVLLRRRGEIQEAAYSLYALGNALEEVAGTPGATAALERIESARGRSGDDPLAAVAEAAQAGALAAALAAHRAAEERFPQTPEKAEALRSQARVLVRRGDFDAARSALERALPRVEELREATRGGELGSSYFAGVQTYYEELVAVLMELDRRRPGEGFSARAATVAERRRARSLLDRLRQTGEVLPEDDPLRQELSVLHREIREREGERLRLETEKASGEKIAAVEAELSRLLLRLDLLEAKRRRRAGLGAAEPLTVEEIQAQVVDEETALLLYSLGEERSWVWLVRPGEVESAGLPSRAVLEEAARRLHGQLGESRNLGAATEARGTAAALAAEILRPLAGRGGLGRLLVVADGALQLVPFGVLPHPDGGGTVLERHEVVHLPSASVLALLRRAAAAREPAPALVAALADPVFDAADPRVASPVATPGAPGGLLGRGGSGSDLERSASELGLGALPRLPATRREVEALLALAPPGEETWSAFDFAARREAVVSGDLARFRILHLATHALLHAEHPELSGVVLSGVDEGGAPVDGFLRGFEIAALRLPAELVVLSACRTALGPQVRGEGLVGLPQSFLTAGAERVVVSLWNASDEATAELMILFYRGLFEQGLSPAAALRQAQLALSRQERWSAPYYWAGFVLVGEGR